VPTLAQRPDRYLREPRLAVRAGGVLLTVRAWEGEGDGEHLLSFGVGSDGALGAPIRSEAPAQPADSEDRAERDGHHVVVHRAGYRSTVILTTPDGKDIVVWDAHGTAAAPALAPVESGTWVAFHHNVREEDGRTDLAKWIAVRFVQADGAVLEPAASMTDRDRDLAGEEQSFEFPTLAVGADGALSIFGRGSHAFWRQDLGTAGFSPRRALGDTGWGCRGRRVAVLGLDEVRLLTARRERAGIEVAVVDVPVGGAPALVTARVCVDGPAPVSSMRAERPDPAVADGRRTLFGDIHQHSAHSDGLGAADEPYLRARHVYGDDFCALTDHESFLGKRIGPGEQAYLEAVAERHDDPGRFATLIGYEWTGRMFPGPGHKVVYWPSAGHPMLSRDDRPSGAELVAAALAAGGFAVPHHVGWTGADVAAHDPRGQPVWEICSCHGCYESFGHALGQRGDLRDQMIDAVLATGLRFGFVAASDGHGLLWHHGVARKRDTFRTGLTAVQARDCTRAAIFDAIRERRCYATSGAKILLDLRVDGAPMGSELEVSGPVSARAVAHGTGQIERLELVGPTGVLAISPGNGDRAVLEAVVDAPHVYARVVQSDGEMAWSSPVFVERAVAGPRR